MGRIGTECMYSPSAFLKAVCGVMESYLKPILYNAITVYSDDAARLYQEAWEILQQLTVETHNSYWTLTKETNYADHEWVERGHYIKKARNLSPLFYQLIGKSYKYRSEVSIFYQNKNGAMYNHITSAKYYSQDVDVIYNAYLSGMKINRDIWKDSDYFEIRNNKSLIHLQISSSEHILMYFFPDVANQFTGSTPNAWIYSSVDSRVCGNLSKLNRARKGILTRFPSYEELLTHRERADREYSARVTQMLIEDLEAKFSATASKVRSKPQKFSIFYRLKKWLDDFVLVFCTRIQNTCHRVNIF